jgi:hypothetical protein
MTKVDDGEIGVCLAQVIWHYCCDDVNEAANGGVGVDEGFVFPRPIPHRRLQNPILLRCPGSYQYNHADSGLWMNLIQHEPKAILSKNKNKIIIISSHILYTILIFIYRTKPLSIAHINFLNFRFGTHRQYITKFVV